MMEVREMQGTTERIRSIPKLRFSEFNDEWKNAKLSKLLKIGSGKDYKHLSIGKIPVYGTGGVMTFVDDYIYEGESVCIGRKGTIDKPVYLNAKFWTVDTLFYTHSFLNVLPKFVYSIFQNINWYKYNEASGVPSLSKKTIEAIVVNTPTIKEQQKIASFLSAVDEKINQLQRKKELLQAYKKGVMQRLFSQQLRFEDANGNDFPEWEEKKLGKVGEIVNGLTYSPKDIDDNGIIVLRSSNVKKRRIDLKDQVRVKVEKYNPVKKGDILICVRNGSKRLIGKNAVIREKDVNLAFGAFMSVFRSSYNEFIFHLFGSDIYKKQVYQNLGATINSINGSDLKKFKIPFPSKEEQTKIASFLSALDAKIDTVSTAIIQTQEFKKGLLQQMFV